MDETAFAKAIEQALVSGVTLDRMMELVYQRWKRDRGNDPLRLCAGTIKDDEPVVEVKWGPLRGVVTPDAARGYGTMFHMCAESAETNSFLLKWFGAAKDQVLAKKLLAALLPKLNTHRCEIIDRIVGPTLDSKPGAEVIDDGNPP